MQTSWHPGRPNERPDPEMSASACTLPVASWGPLHPGREAASSNGSSQQGHCASWDEKGEKKISLSLEKFEEKN